MSESNPLDKLPSPDFSTKRIYAYQLSLSELARRIKVGETERSVRSRVKEQVNTAGLSDVVKILMDEPAVAADGRTFRDVDVHEVLKRMPGVTHRTEGGGVEWFECSLEQVQSAYNSVYAGETFTRVRDKSFGLRGEQIRAIEMADAYLTFALADGREARFLWNAKMRFGKTFAAYHLAMRRNAKRVLVVTYKPAVEDAWRTDLETHTDFEGWVFFSRASTEDPSFIATDTPLVCFSSLQDLRGRTVDGAIKEQNQWIHDVVWDLVIVDEYHYGAWNDATQELLSGEVGGGETELANARGADSEEDDSKDLVERLDNIKGKVFLCLSGTPFRAIASNEFSDEQIFNWTYTDEQRAKEEFAANYPDQRNPYGALPQMNLLVYQLPKKLREVAIGGKRNEFDLNTFFAATGNGKRASFTHRDQVQAWLDWLRGQDVGAAVQVLDVSTAKPFPYADTNVLPYMNHSVWFLPAVASVFAMRNLLAEPHNAVSWGQFTVLPVAGKQAGDGADALPPVREAICSGYDTKTITLTCGKLLTGVTVPQWSAILMLKNLEAPESYFQAAFRVQSPWSVWNPDGTNPNEERVLKPACLVLDFAPTRALRLFADYGMRLGRGMDADNDVKELSKYLPVLGFDGTRMQPVDVDEIIDTAFQTTTVDTRWMQSRKFINPDASKLELLSEEVRRALICVTKQRQSDRSADEDENVINKTPELKEGEGNTSNDSEDGGSNTDQEDDLPEEDLANRLSFIAKRINAFMYLSDDIEKNLKDVLATDEAELFRMVMELRKDEMAALVDAGLFHEQAMRLAIHQFRRADVASFRYTGLDPRSGPESIKGSTDA
ncbi:MULTISPECIES: restriction endonuclease [Cyanophyceae]|uniref:Bacteriophage T5 Orf172 DNA-binding domain-containing protein n=1 Tax=Leptolyngbya subtilissima DQ-A4 TaxID=2933933 RepID=A0ABV0KBL9_9CYAN|nr:restriction endonuclease [Nodosilinea sp. FACHB-141]MBD2114929.1 restriction endonuclease [Nodosilinea sp. FACHB-141]